MLTERDVVQRVQHLTVTRLRVWVAQGWIKPADRAAQSYSEADLARAALICDLEDELGFAEEDVPVLLNLIDQIHGLRSQLTRPARRAGRAAARHPRRGEDAHHQKRGRRRAMKSLGGPILFLLAVVALTFCERALTGSAGCLATSSSIAAASMSMRRSPPRSSSACC